MNNDMTKCSKLETLGATVRLCAQEMGEKEKTTQSWSTEQMNPSLGPLSKVLPRPVLMTLPLGTLTPSNISKAHKPSL